jgi:CubicO group peptidase (beta-lactamase class C family)
MIHSAEDSTRSKPMNKKTYQELIYKVEQAAVETDFSGVVSVYQDTSTIYDRAFGYRDIKNKLPNLTSTKFGIASGTKLFTGLGIGKLIDQGLISLETSVGELDQAYTQFIDPHATILHLLTHTSGIYDYYDEESHQDWDHFFVEIPWYKLETPSDYFPLFKNQPYKFKPGERFSYANGGYVFLGMIIEKMTGRLYRDFIQEHVLQAAHMHHSGFYGMNDLPENTANGYLLDRRRTNIYNLPLRGGGDGGLFTTSADLGSFWNRLLAYKIISKELTDIYLSTQHAFNDVSGYGCGIYKHLDDSMYSISGGDAGVGFDSRHLQTEKLTVNILSNITDGEAAIRDVLLESLGLDE